PNRTTVGRSTFERVPLDLCSERCATFGCAKLLPRFLRLVPPPKGDGCARLQPAQAFLIMSCTMLQFRETEPIFCRDPILSFSRSVRSLASEVGRPFA